MLDFMLENIMETISAIIILILSGFIVNVTKKVADKIKQDTNSDTVKEYIDVAEKSIEMAVRKVNQLYVDELKSKGAFDKVSQICAKEKAIDICKELIKEESINAINTLYKDFESWLDTQIEKQVSLAKGRG